MSTMMYGKLQKMTFALLTAFVLMLSQCAPALASSVGSVQVRSAPLASGAITKDGMVRVYLASLGNPSALDLTVNGNYSMSHNGHFISNGSRLRISFSSSSGNISITYNGQTTSVGKSFSLRRHSAAGTNGILIAQSRDSQNPYPGDLSFEAVSNGSGYMLYTIAHIYIENYLYGVLPYEMGNSSGLEALKAQAVAARTYTVRMMESRSSGRYDVKDTTSDQVYRGTPAGNANCVAAVDATKGIVLMYGSQYITTYYSASNGGQTETSRNGTGYAYMKVKDDPFDYANASSIVKKKTIYADLTSSSNSTALISLLQSKAVSTLQRSGYQATISNTFPKTLKAVTPHTPMYASPSRLYTQMDFTFTVSTVNSAGQAAMVTLTETCGIFSELESILGMSIQSLQNELWSVEKNSQSFVLQARRYGHGMGMSQRGAMHMAKLGYSYDQILGFYYEDCKRVKHSFTNKILSASSTDQQITVETPADLEENEQTGCTGTVTLAENNTALAIRATAVSNAQVIGSAPNGAMLEVLAQSGEWYQIRFGEIIGFVPASSLSVSGTPPQQQQDVTSVLGFALVTANDFVNLRASGSMNAKVLGTAPTGAVLTVFSQTGSWAKVQYNALTAYVNTGFISSVTSEYPTSGLTNGTQRAEVITENGTGTVNLRQSASTSAKLIDRLTVGTVVTVLSDDGSWCRITCSQGEGYMLSDFLKYLDAVEEAPSEEETNDEDSPQDENETENEEYEPQRAVVNTEFGALNMRAQAKAGSKVLTTIPKGTEVIVLAKGDVWTAVRYGSYDGYVMTAYLQFENEAEIPMPPASDGNVILSAKVITPSGTLNLRALPRTGSEILERIPPYTVLRVQERYAEWSMVEYLGITGYVMNAFLAFDEVEESVPEIPSESDDNEEIKIPAESVPAKQTAYVNTQSGALNMRQQPSLNSGVYTTIPQYAEVTVTAFGNEWCAVRYGMFEGYVMTSYLRFTDTEPTKPDENIDTDLPADRYEPVLMWVKTEKGSLNLRTAPDGNSDVLTTIAPNTQVTLLEKGTEWCLVSYQEYTGYVMSRFLTAEQPKLKEEGTTAPEADRQETPSYGDEGDEPDSEPYVTVGGIVLDVTLELPDRALFASAVSEMNVYSMCAENGDILTTISADEEVEILLVGDLWCRIAYQNVQGYCQRNKLNVR